MNVIIILDRQTHSFLKFNCMLCIGRCRYTALDNFVAIDQGRTIGEGFFTRDLNECEKECRGNRLHGKCKSFIYCYNNFCELKDKAIDSISTEKKLYNCTANKDCPNNCTSYSHECSSRKCLKTFSNT